MSVSTRIGCWPGLAMKEGFTNRLLCKRIFYVPVPVQWVSCKKIGTKLPYLFCKNIGTRQSSAQLLVAADTLQMEVAIRSHTVTRKKVPNNQPEN